MSNSSICKSLKVFDYLLTIKDKYLIGVKKDKLYKYYKGGRVELIN